MEETYVMDKEHPGQAQHDIDRFEARLEKQRGAKVGPGGKGGKVLASKAKGVAKHAEAAKKVPSRPLSAKSRGVAPAPTEDEEDVAEAKQVVKDLDAFDKLHGVKKGSDSD